MVNVDNSFKNRIFIDEFDIDNRALFDSIFNLKKLVESKIEKVDLENGDYSILDEFRGYDNAKYLSIYRYRNVVIDKINELLRDRSIHPDLKTELRDIKDNIYLILIGSFERMKLYLDSKIETLLVHRTDDEKHDSFKKYQTIFEDLYKNELSSSTFKKSFFEMFKNVHVCPYCNRNFINPIYKKKQLGKDYKKWSPDIEHFYPKSIYPFLSLSISNLLPSCTFCNKIKSNYDTYNKCKSPYQIKSDDIKFKFAPLSNEKHVILLESKDNIKNTELFNLDGLYDKVHSQYVNDIFLEMKKHPIENRRYLKKFFSLSIDSQDKIYKQKFCNYYKEIDFNKQPLSKMIKELFFHIKENELK
ncbi:hypothetical protein [Halarcobacter anaerophilus]|uniref:HNH nuclease domain-containing protein n=1 Tax=Halarcobacter anaerophilus TaxID=877500 RepID=A0A4Q0Y5K9_9BACT|nr:hypothetical protein [Halarcobacter anaerophilus]QDF27715.1 hypothetical protein AANAER_0205 [Halarcobacter anaerophilus]RXJ64059.1 hypothetical protein CRV06_03725 [Halarcobacter anaerophilus]